MALADFQSLVARRVRAPADLITADDIGRAIASAVRQYSQDRPRTLVRDVTWVDTGHFGPPPAELDVESRVLEAECPIGNMPRTLRKVAISLSPEALSLVCADSLAAGDVLRLEFTAAHELDADTDTIPGDHRDAVGSWAAHLLCRELATYFSGERESSISADGSNTDSRARNYSARSKEYRAAYFGALGLVDPMSSGSGAGALPVAGAGAVAAWPARLRPWFRSGV